MALMNSTTIGQTAEERGIELQGIERTPPDARTHTRIFDNFTVWLSPNLGITTLALGALSTTLFGLGFWDSVFAILIFNALGALPVAFFSTLGPRLGLRQMTISRFSFGWEGATFMALINAVAILGWSVVDAIVGGQLIAILSRGAIPQQVGVFLIAVITLLVSIYGYRSIHRYQRFAWIPMAAAFFILTLVAAPRMSVVPTTALGLAEVASFISFGGAVFGFATGWSSYAADYNVKQPQATSARQVFWLTFLGVSLPCMLLEILGVALSTAFRGVDSGNQLLADAARPLGGFGGVLLFLLALSVVANNIPNAYSLGLSIQVLGRPFQRVERSVWALVGSVIYVLIAVAAAPNFNQTLSDFLLLVAYWLGPWSVIVALEHFVFRRGVGGYNLEDWNRRRGLPAGWAALASFLVGFGGVLLGASQAYYVGPLAHALGGMDIGFELGLAGAALSYLLLRRIELAGRDASRA
jgi:NCS1 nucleoside transporter family